MSTPPILGGWTCEYSTNTGRVSGGKHSTNTGRMDMGGWVKASTAPILGGRVGRDEQALHQY